MSTIIHSNGVNMRRTIRLGKLVWIALVLLLGSFSSLPAQAGDNVSEYSLKAAVVFNMPLFTEWPPTTNTTETKATFNLCVYGETPLLEALHQLEGKAIKGGKLVVVSVNDKSSLELCHALVVPKGLGNPGRAALIRRLQNQSTLVIAEDAEPPPDQVMINLIMEDGKVTFQANPELAKSAGLKLSSKLLRLAKVVYPL